MAGKVESDGTGCNRVTFKFTIKNYGVSPVYNVSLIDNLDNTFINPATYTVVSAPVSITGALATNALFSGNGNNTNLLTSTNSLSIGGVDTIMVKVRFCSNGGVTTYSNIAVVSANSSSTGLGNTGTDISTNGLNPDPNGNGNPSDNDEGIVTVFSGSDLGVIVPQGFNPNDVNGNQTWILKGIENFPDNVVSVYNRWGNLVYQKEGYSNAEAWNGIANSNLPKLGANRLPQGTYYYVIEFKNSDQAALKGFVVLQY
jgi:gliding motility-associated-like protein